MKCKMTKLLFKPFILAIICLLFMFLIAQLILYYFMYKDTDTIVEDFCDVICNTKDSNIDYGVLINVYDYSTYFPVESVKNIKVERELVKHNFQNGYMDVLCSYDINPHDAKNSVGAHRYITRWYIEKLNGRWRVYAIDELSGAVMVRVAG